MVHEDSFPSLNKMKLVHIQPLCSITTYFNIILPLRLGLPHDLPPSEIWTKIWHSFPYIPCVLHASSITLSLFYPHHQYLVKSIRHGSLQKALVLKQYRPFLFKTSRLWNSFLHWNISRNPTPVLSWQYRQCKKIVFYLLVGK